VIEMLLCCNKINAVEHAVIQGGLVGQAGESVASAFDLVPNEFAVDHSQVYAHRAVPNTHFLNDARVHITLMLAAQARSHCQSNV